MKSWLKSKTIWVNILVVGAGILGVLVGNEWVMSNPQIATALVPVLAGVNMILRFVTTEAIK